jgi:hypothetical protein
LTVADFQMRDDAALYLFLSGLALWIVGAVLMGRLVRDVARVAPPKTNRPFKNLSEANSLVRVWREHVKHFPASGRRTAFVIVIVAAFACFGFGMALAK